MNLGQFFAPVLAKLTCANDGSQLRDDTQAPGQT